MIGRVIEDDMFGIARRLKSVDDGYFVFLNYKSGKFEVHNRYCSPNTLCLVLPYETLDERTVRHVLSTRRERIKEIIACMEEQNEKAERKQRRDAVDKILSAVS